MRSKKDCNRVAVSASDVEQNIGNEPLGKKKIKRPDSRVCIHVHSIRKRLADPDGVSAKAAIDGIVNAGILKDDSSRYVKTVTHSQEKGKTEKTIITLSW